MNKSHQGQVKRRSHSLVDHSRQRNTVNEYKLGANGMSLTCCGVQVIVEKMIEYLRTANDDVVKADIVKRVSDLAERFAPDTQWFIDTMNQVCTSHLLEVK